MLKKHLSFFLFFLAMNFALLQADIISVQHNGVALQTLAGPVTYIVTAGSMNISGTNYFLVARYTTAGVLDTTFGTNGYTTTLIGTNANALALDIDSSGNLLVAGAATISGISQFVIARYTSGGILDTTYGPGSVGYNAITAGGDGALARAVKVDASGNAVVVGTVVVSGVPELLIARFDSTGNLDATFNTTGYVIQLVGSASYGYAVAIQGDGNIIAAGQARVSDVSQFLLFRFNTDGSLDSSFNSTGIVTTIFGANAIARGLVIQDDGNIVAAGYSDTQVALARYIGSGGSAGSLDTAFNVTGKVTTSVGSLDKAYAVGLDSSANIIITGSSDAQLLVIRYTSAGALDTTFNSTGIVGTTISTTLNESFALVIQSDDEVLVAGYSTDDSALVLYNTDGTLDTTFGNGGFVIVPASTVPSDSHGHLFVYDTTTQSVTTANTMQDITFNTNVELDGWTHSASSATFICTLPGKYLVRYDLEITDTSGVAIASTFSALVVRAPSSSIIFTEIPGSQGCIQLGILSNQTLLLSRSFIITAQLGDQFKAQFTGSATTNELISGSGVGTTKPSASLTIARILK